MTVTKKESILSKLDNSSLTQAKKKSQTIREALTSYLIVLSRQEKIKRWEESNKDDIEKYNKYVLENGQVLQNSRMF